jgi:hypothetical protein
MMHLFPCNKLVLTLGIAIAVQGSAFAQTSLPPAGQAVRRVTPIPTTKTISQANVAMRVKNGSATGLVAVSASTGNSQSPPSCPDPSTRTAPSSSPFQAAAALVSQTQQDTACRDNATNSAAWEAWNQIVNYETSKAMTAADLVELPIARNLAYGLNTTQTNTAAQVYIGSAAPSARSQLSTGADASLVNSIAKSVESVKCGWSYTTGTSSAAGANSSNSPVNTYTYTYIKRNWGFFPLIGKGCGDSQIQNFFAQDSWQALGSQVGYKYNVVESESQVSSDLFTMAFRPGIQVVFGATVTGSGSQNSTSTSTSSSSGSPTTERAGYLAHPMDTTTSSSTTGTTDPVSTAIAKLEAGGDFNISAPIPIHYLQGNLGVLETSLSPNVGFTVNGLSSQNTITNATYQTYNIPLEFYYESVSVSNPTNPSNNATFFVDVRPQGEFISSTLAQQLGPSVGTKMFLLQAAAGVNFQKSIRLSAQYNYGNTSVFQAASSPSSSSSSTSPTTSIKGVQFAISFTPQSKSSN